MDLFEICQLLKPYKLTEDERKSRRKHPVFAYEMPKPIAYLHKDLDTPYCHHENLNGIGYPRDLKGGKVPN